MDRAGFLLDVRQHRLGTVAHHVGCLVHLFASATDVVVGGRDVQALLEARHLVGVLFDQSLPGSRPVLGVRQELEEPRGFNSQQNQVARNVSLVVVQFGQVVHPAVLTTKLQVQRTAWGCVPSFAIQHCFFMTSHS